MQLKILRSYHLIKVWNIHASATTKQRWRRMFIWPILYVVMSAYKVVPTISKDTPYDTFPRYIWYECYFSQECFNRIEILLRLTYAMFLFHSTWRLKTTNGKYRPGRGHCRSFRFSSSIPKKTGRWSEKESLFYTLKQKHQFLYNFHNIYSLIFSNKWTRHLKLMRCKLFFK